MSLLISTVLSGSRNRLAPLPELPCTMPGMAARCSDRTTRTNRPARSVTTRSWRYLAVSRPRRYDSSVPRSRLRWRRSRSRNVRSLGLASSSTSPSGSIAPRMALTSRSKDCAPARTVSECRIRSPRGLPERRADAVHGSQKARQTDELQRFDDPSFDGQLGDRAFEVGRGVEAERGVGLEVGHSLAGGRETGCHLVGIGLGGEAVDRRGPQRGERQAANRGHDTIEFERLEGSLVHRGSTAQTPAPNG